MNRRTASTSQWRGSNAGTCQAIKTSVGHDRSAWSVLEKIARAVDDERPWREHRRWHSKAMDAQL